MDNDKKLRQLKYYTGHGWPILPLHWIKDDGSCSCGKSTCRSPGKHPLTSNGLKDATTFENTVLGWHKRWPLANWGMRTGDKSTEGAGILAVDIDAKSQGYESWDLLLEEHQDRIETIEVDTGGGGTHLWFEYPEGADYTIGAGVLGPGLDIRGNNGYVVVPPSKTEKSYKFNLTPDDVALAELPKWIASTLNGQPTTPQKRAADLESAVPEGERHQALTTLAGSMRRVGMSEDEIMASLMSVANERFASGSHPVTTEEIQEVAAWVKDKPRSYNLTDLGNAERFVSDHRDKILYCKLWKKWLVWDGKRWKIDDTEELERLAYRTVRRIYAEASDAKDDDTRKKLAKHAIKSEDRARVNAMIDLASPFVPIKPDQLDRWPMLLNVENGTIDLKSGKIKEHERSDLITKLVDVPYDDLADCPKWTAAVDLFTGGDKELAYFLQVAIGYSLTGKIDEHVLFLLFGHGANGKTTFLELLRRLLGDYCVKINIESIMATFGRGNAATPDVARMAGARMVLASEIAESRKLNEPLVKDVTGGDVLSARYLFSNPFEFSPSHKLWIYGNHEPKITGTDEGIWRRIREIPFKVTIPPEDRRPMSELIDEFMVESPGILAWAVAGCLFWQNMGLPASKAVTEATSEYRSEQDLVRQFLDEKTVSHPDYDIVTADLFEEWQEWVKSQNDKDAARRTQRWFTTQMIRRYGYTRGGDGNKKLLGLKLS